MAKINTVNIYGRLEKDPVIVMDKETGEYQFGFCYVDTVRSLRDAGDDLHFVKHTKPMVLSREKEILDAMSSWKENDMVMIKGVIHTKALKKTSFCDHCKEKNEVFGNLITINPIHVLKIKSYGDDKMAAVEDLVNNREISNQVQIYGTLLKDPQIFTTKRGLQITQYPIAINRKFTVRTDDPTIKTDYPVVKSYGEQARDDKTYLKFQSEIIIDGFLQARTVRRKKKCDSCGEEYLWTDNCMEIVPYAVEHIKNCRTPEEVEADFDKKAEEYKQMLYEGKKRDELDEEMTTSEIEKDLKEDKKKAS